MIRRNGQHDRGVIFVAALILLAGMSVVIVALANEVSLDLRMATALVDADQTLEIAKVGIDKIIYAMSDDPNWRTTYTSGTQYGPFALGDGEFYVTITDADGDLADSTIDSVTVTSVATYKGTTRTVSAVLAPPVHDAMMYLAVMWDSGRKIEIKNGPRVYGDIMSANDVTVVGALPDLRGDIYCRDANKVAGTLDDTDTDVIRISPTPADPNPNIDWFISRGSAMTPPESGGTIRITDKRITPNTNPYGFSNANGIYYIDANGDHVEFRRCHIEATIIIKRADKVFFEDGIVHRPAFPYYPALVVIGKDDGKGKVEYDLDKNLSENESGVDFNGDGDTNDVFTPSVAGVIYASRKIEGMQTGAAEKIVRFKGVLISEEIKLVGAGNILEQDPSLSTDLVEQFQGVGMKLVKGSFKIE